METENKRLIVVLGMHRSGTSAITRGLQVTGVELGDRLIPPIDGNNAKGFWEDIDLNALNNEMLHAIDSDWCHLAAIDSIDVEILCKQGYFLRAAEMLQQKADSAPVFGIKDPRVAKLLPFWKEVFSHCKFDVSYVMAIRNPLSVVKSLSKRDGLEAEQSYLLWLGHVITSLTGSAGSKRVLVDYDRLMQSPDMELVRIAKNADLKIDPAELQIYKTEFLDSALQNTVYDLNDLLLDNACPPIVREVYAALLNVASDKARFEDAELQNKIVRWSDEFDRLKSSLLLADRLFTQKLIATQAVAERDSQIASLSQTVTERDNQIASLDQAVDDARRELAQVLASKSWQITKPFRFARRVVVNRSHAATRRALSDNSRALWRALPISHESKRSLKGVLFNTFPWIFRWSKAYQAWVAFNAPVNYAPMNNTANRQPEETGDEYVPLIKASPLEQKPAKLICFYLPQFHAIPENDEWWGKGFTEWTNVQPA